MTLAAVKDWIKTLVADCGDGISAGVYDARRERCLAVLDAKDAPPPVVAIGGPQNSSWDRRGVSLIILWGRDSSAAEAKAQAVYTALFAVSRPVIGGKRVFQLKPVKNGPQALGQDSRGVFAYSIDFQILYVR